MGITGGKVLILESSLKLLRSLNFEKSYLSVCRAFLGIILSCGEYLKEAMPVILTVLVVQLSSARWFRLTNLFVFLRSLDYHSVINHKQCCIKVFNICYRHLTKLAFVLFWMLSIIIYMDMDLLIQILFLIRSQPMIAFNVLSFQISQPTLNISLFMLIL